MDETDFLLHEEKLVSNSSSFLSKDQNRIVSWHKLIVKIEDGSTNQAAKSKILHEQSGYVASNEALYIMGASGAGKTTFLNCLSGKIEHRGQVLLNKSLDITENNFAKFGAFVTQDDVLFPSLTCFETLVFA